MHFSCVWEAMHFSTGALEEGVDVAVAGGKAKGKRKASHKQLERRPDAMEVMVEDLLVARIEALEEYVEALEGEIRISSASAWPL